PSSRTSVCNHRLLWTALPLAQSKGCPRVVPSNSFRQLASKAVRHIELAFAVALVLAGVWLTIGLARDPSATSAQVAATLTALTPAQTASMEARLPVAAPETGPEDTREGRSGPLKLFSLKIHTDKSSMPDLIVELKRAFHQHTTAWRVIRDPQTNSVRYVHQGVTQG